MFVQKRRECVVRFILVGLLYVIYCIHMNI